MEILDLLATYSKAQKLSGTHFVLLGVGLVLAAATVQIFFKANELSQGFKVSALICGILFLAMGFSYRNYVDKQQAEMISMYQQNQTEAIENEKARIAKTIKDFPMYQYTFSGLIILGLAVVVFVPSDYWKGIAYAVMITFVCAMFLETASSHPSMKTYYNATKTINYSIN